VANFPLNLMDFFYILKGDELGEEE